MKAEYFQIYSKRIRKLQGICNRKLQNKFENVSSQFMRNVKLVRRNFLSFHLQPFEPFEPLQVFAKTQLGNTF